ncbi:MAG: lysophospholipid acyltransferase family protein [Lentisphaerae bacterium]|nr:lysophospholipid acyltransferase family protein [Lentisphaerota bacterium]MBT4816078.1 lysophospholipid acyltransferase family protein [Lentisphaerota bacterium]MBT5613163.1 lysophospholipid acyltransferase family protein [Lentisphaerota bacterium]MBT7061947.1 lysophospholipid acyltransferase family protein [Lentisphaerota bacterium]MBT7844545.1 lysophospholipid acyltransferase family protein [Lentisphaerota bacterium]
MTVLVDIVFWTWEKFPLWFRVRSGMVVGWLLRCVFRFRRDVVEGQVQASFPELDGCERGAMIRDVYRHLGLLLTELFALPTIPRDTLLSLCCFEGLEHLLAALSEGKGAFVLAAHSGNWELGLVASAYQLAGSGNEGHPTHIIVKEIKGRVGNYASRRLREPHGVSLIPRKQALRRIKGALADGAAVGFVLDQNMTSDEGVFVDFFGRPACTMSGLALLSQRYHVPVVPACFRRDPDLRRHHIRFLPPIEWENVGDSLEQSIVHNTQRYTGCLESMIRACPAQWLWIHRRWKTKPAPGSVPVPTPEPASSPDERPEND